MKKQQEAFEKEVEVILDTNMLMTPSQISFDIFEAISDALLVPKITFSVMQATITELTTIAQARSKEAREARVALHLIKQKNVIIIPPPKKMEKISYADIVIITYATEKSKTRPEMTILVATNDRMLKKQLLEKNITVMSVAGKQRMIIRKPMEFSS